MGTNVYLHHKVCPHCGRPEALVHIGKSSGGWVWLWRGYRGWEADELPFGRQITSGEDWWQVLAASLADEREPGEIRDEYGAVVTLQELRKWVETKRRGGRRGGAADSYSRPDGEDEITFREFS